MSDRLSRKEIKHDKFVEEMETAYGVARKNARLILGAVIGVLVLIGVLVGIILWLGSQEKKAQLRLAEAIEILESPVSEPGMPEPPGGRAYPSEESKVEAAEPILREVIDSYSGRDAADVARLYLARIEAGRGENEPAIEKLREFVSDHPDHILAQSARVSLYELRLASGQHAEVISDLEKELSATSSDEGLPTDVALALLARAYETQNDSEKSRSAWQRLMNEYPDSAFTLEAQRKLNRG